MLEAFAVIFIVAFTFMCFAFVVLEDDTQKKSYRPVFLLAISIAAWLSSMGLLISPSTSTVYYPPTNIVEISNGITTNVNYPSYNTTTTTGLPFPTYSFYEYMTFAIAMSLIELIFLVQFMIKMSVTEIGDSIGELHSKRNR